MTKSSRKKSGESQKRDAGVQRVEDDRYMIKVGHLDGTFVARAFPKPDGRSKGMLFEAKGKSTDEAVEALRAKMEVSEADDIAGRRTIETSGFLVPQTKEYASALRHVQLSKAQVDMLKAHAVSDAGMTIDELAGAAGYTSARAASTAYGKVGGAIRENLKLEAAASQHAAGQVGFAVLAVVGEPSGADGAEVWIMHTELRDAIRLELR